MKPTFWDRALKFPPIMVRLMARRRYGPPLTTHEIAMRSGLTVYEIETISQSTDWSCCSFPTMHRFLDACECNFDNPQHLDRMMDYIRHKPTWKYLRMSPQWETYYNPLLMRYCEYIRKEL